MKYIITEEQLSKYVRRYLNSIELDVSRADNEIWITNMEGKAIFYYYIDNVKTYLNIDPDIWSTVRGMFGLDDLTARMEILFWFEDKFDRRVDEIHIWWD
jgi:hypothetical protein